MGAAVAWSPSWHYDSLHLDALLLALASSTDNFTVGVSRGIQKKPLPLWANGCISVCNAMGAWFAGHGGIWLSLYVSSANSAEGTGRDAGNNHNKNFPLYLSALAFGGLAFSEWRAYREERIKTESRAIKAKKDDNGAASSSTSTPSTMSNIWSVLKLSVPMTLNNLAGGVAGGAAGLTPPMSAFYALVASFVSMSAGYGFGLRLGSAIMDNHYQKVNTKNEKGVEWLHPSLLSAVLLGILCLLTLQEAMFG